MNKITILGSGTSTGVPILGCKCGICQSKDPRNNRLRSSALLELTSKKNILIDASPDLRAQLLRARTDSLNGVIITHDHADHTHGIDDLRAFSFERTSEIPVYTDPHCMNSLTMKFPYIFQREKIFAQRPILGGGIPHLELHPILPGLNVVCDEEFHFFSLPHGYGSTLSFIHRRLGYIIDCVEISQEALDFFSNAKLEILVIDCLRYDPHQTHLHFDKTLRYIEMISPRLAILTHMGHEIDYLDIINQLKRRGIKNVIPAIDGQSFLYS